MVGLCCIVSFRFVSFSLVLLRLVLCEYLFCNHLCVSLSLFHTHTYTYTLSLSLLVSPSPSLSLSLSFSLSFSFFTPCFVCFSSCDCHHPCWKDSILWSASVLFSVFGGPTPLSGPNATDFENTSLVPFACTWKVDHSWRVCLFHRHPVFTLNRSRNNNDGLKEQSESVLARKCTTLGRREGKSGTCEEWR